MSSPFNILQESPHDRMPLAPEPLLEPGTDHWMPSRYNVRATTEDGRLVLWNSFRGTMSVFEAEQKPAIEGMLSQKGFVAPAKGVVQYLFRRGFLVKKGTDEYRRIQLGFGQQHYRTDTLQLILLTSEDCNFRCNYCYEDFARGTMQPWVRDAIKKLVTHRLPTLRHLSISWFGGEPLYGWPAIEELAPFFMETADAHSLRHTNNMTTNGYLLTPEVAEKLLSWRINTFQITLDGPPEHHDRSRPARDGSGTFEVILQNLKALSLRSENFFVDVRVNFDQKNRADLPKLLDLLAQELPDPRFKVRFRAVGQWGGPNDADLSVCGTGESAAVQLEMTAEARKRGLRLADDIRRVQGLGAQVCYAARPYNFIVGATGKLMKCTIDLDKQDRNVVGRLTEDGNLDLDEDKFALWTEPAFERDQKCQKCVVLPVCQGTFCPQIRMDTGDSPCTPLRMGVKKELLEAAESTEPQRKVIVGSGKVSREAISSSEV